jgi:hypothetical protein
VHSSIGKQGKDKITGYQGTIVARCEWQNGCIRTTLQAKGLKDGKPIEPYTCDEQDVEVEEPKVKISQKKPSGGPRTGNMRRPDSK